MAGQSIPVIVVNHLTMDIAVAPDKVWQTILGHFVATDNWVKAGYAVEPLDDPATPLGGYHMRKEQDGAIVDERVVHITERDETARRLSLFADYRSAPDGLQVLVTYHARETADGARYTIDCHTRMGIEKPAGGTRADFAAAIDALKTQFDEHLIGFLKRLKETLEATG
jgi:hypothetical protein